MANIQNNSSEQEIYSRKRYAHAIVVPRLLCNKEISNPNFKDKLAFIYVFFYFHLFSFMCDALCCTELLYNQLIFVIFYN